jgi:folate-binding protein YgfZ
MPIALLPDRGVVEVAGEDRVAFLQGLVTNDVAAVRPGRAVWAALLTPQGKWLADFFMLADGNEDGGTGRLLLDCERAQAPTLVQRLSRFRLRSRVTVRDASDAYAVHVAWGAAAPPAPPPPGAVAAPDPRLPEAGWRVLTPAPIPIDAAPEDWDRHRLALGLPDGSRDLEPEKTILLEAGFDELAGVSWDKGCYMGQELTARTKYRGLVKRRLVPVAVDGPLPPRGTPIRGATGGEVGEMRSGRDGLGLAVLRLEAIGGTAPLPSGEARLTPRVPGWMRLPSPAAAGTAAHGDG